MRHTQNLRAVRLLVALVALLSATFAAFGTPGSILAGATGQNVPLHNTDAECGTGDDAGEWHFVINQLDSDGDAPASISITFAVGGTISIPLDRVTGGVAHYETTQFPGDSVTGGTAVLPSGWEGQFNLSHSNCDPVKPTDVPPTDVPPTDVPPTDVPPTDVPPTDVPPTDVPPTDPPGKTPDDPKTPAPTEKPVTSLPETGTTPTDSNGGMILAMIGFAAILLMAAATMVRRSQTR